MLSTVKTLPVTNRPASLSLVPAADCPAVAYSTVLLGRVPTAGVPSDLAALESTDPLSSSYLAALGEPGVTGFRAWVLATIHETLLTDAAAKAGF